MNSEARQWSSLGVVITGASIEHFANNSFIAAVGVVFMLFGVLSYVATWGK